MTKNAGHSPRVHTGGERGSETAQNTLVYPALFLLIFIFIQAGLFYHAHNIAQGAASVAYQSARAYDGSERRGQADGEAFLRKAGVMKGTKVIVNRGVETTSVTVSGTTNVLVPGFPWSTITETISGPTERYVAP